MTPEAASTKFPSPEKARSFTLPAWPVKVRLPMVTRPKDPSARTPPRDTAMAVIGWRRRAAGFAVGTCNVARMERSTLGVGAPPSIHALSTSIWTGAGCGSLRGGMNGFFWPVIRWVRRESAALPGTMALPLSPPAIRLLNVSTENSPSSSSSLWQPAQYSRRIGATSL